MEVDHKISLNALGQEPLKARTERVEAKLMFKVLNKIGPKSLTSLFNYKNEISKHGRKYQTAVCLRQTPIPTE